MGNNKSGDIFEVQAISKLARAVRLARRAADRRGRWARQAARQSMREV